LFVFLFKNESTSFVLEVKCETWDGRRETWDVRRQMWKVKRGTREEEIFNTQVSLLLIIQDFHHIAATAHCRLATVDW